MHKKDLNVVAWRNTFRFFFNDVLKNQNSHIAYFVPHSVTLLLCSSSIAMKFMLKLIFHVLRKFFSHHQKFLASSCCCGFLT